MLKKYNNYLKYKIMKKTLLILTVMLSYMAASAQPISKSFVANDFSGITATSVFEIELIKHGVESVIVMADREVMPYVEVKVVMGQLNFNLDMNRMPKSLKRNINPIKVKVNMKRELSWLSLSGASRLISKSPFLPESFNGQISGASSASGLDISCKNSRISLSGASDITIKGKAVEAEYEFSGACKAVVIQDIENFSIECSGATKLDFTGRTGRVEAEISGATSVKLRGNADILEAEVSGASKLNAIEFIVNDADIDLSGVSFAVVNVQKNLEAEVSGGSNLEYKGTPIIRKISVNSLSNIKKIN